MTWLHENLQIIATIGSGIAVYSALRVAAKREAISLAKRMDKIEGHIEKIETDLQDIKTRLTVLETFMNIFIGNFKIGQQPKTDP